MTHKITLKTLLALAIGSQWSPQIARAEEQSASTPLEETVVVGSRIKRKDLVSSSPTVTANQQGLAESGSATLDSYLSQLPQFQPGQGSFSNSTSGGTVGQSTLNLRGLGPQRNLILLDGQRMQSSNANGAIDLNTIPSNAISNVEIVSGGASATYGSDAMSGVVNFNTRSDLNGFEASLKLTQPRGGVGSSKLYGLAFGADYADSKGYFLLAGETVDREAVSIQDRDFFLEQAASGFTPFSRTLPNAAPSQEAVDAVFANYGISGVSRRSFFSVNDDGSLFAVSGGQATNYRGPQEAPFLVSDSSFGYHPGFNNLVQVPLQRNALFAKTRYEFSDSVSAYGHLQFASSEAQNKGGEPVLAAPWSVFVPVSNPFVQANSDLSTLLASRNNPDAPIEIQLRFGPAGPRTYNTESEVYQGLFGLKGYVEAADLSWDIHASMGQAVNTDTTTSGSVSYLAMQQLADAPDGGDSLCAGGYQMFNGLNQVSDECLQFISRTPQNETTLKQSLVEGFVEGKLTSLPAGDVRYALGAYYRKNSYEFIPDNDIAANRLASLSATQYTQGDIDVSELSAELYVPLVSGKSFAESLNLTLGYRVSEYNLAGRASTYKAEFDWRPIDILLLRTGYQHALRAPNVEEFFNAGTQQVSNIGSPVNGAGDPCDYRHPGLSGEQGEAIAELCVATGLDEGLLGVFRQPSNALVTTTFGDRSLAPEEADSMTIGMVLESPWSSAYLQDMSLTMDFYSIEIEKAIAAIPADQSLAKCYNLDGSNPEYRQDNFFCQQFERQSSGIFNFVNQPYLNLGGYKTQGVDFSFDWAIPSDWLANGSALQFTSLANYLSKFEVAIFEDSPFEDFAGTISNTESYPEWRWVNSLTWELDRLAITGRWRYISSMDDSSTITNAASTTEGSESYSYLDISSVFHLAENWSVRAGVNNLNDETPPIIGGSPGVTNLGTFDGIGRTWYLQTQFTF